MSYIGAHDQQLARLATAIAQRVGPQRYHVWFNNSTRLDLKQDGLEIAVPNDFISEWIGSHFSQPIQEAAHEVLGCSLPVRFSVVPQLFEIDTTDQSPASAKSAKGKNPAEGNFGGIFIYALFRQRFLSSRRKPGSRQRSRASGFRRNDNCCVFIF